MKFIQATNIPEPKKDSIRWLMSPNEYQSINFNAVNNIDKYIKVMDSTHWNFWCFHYTHKPKRYTLAELSGGNFDPSAVIPVVTTAEVLDIHFDIYGMTRGDSGGNPIVMTSLPFTANTEVIKILDRFEVWDGRQIPEWI